MHFLFFVSLLDFSTFNFTVPWLSFMAIVVLCVVTIVLYFIPLRYLLLAWGKSNPITNSWIIFYQKL